MFYSCLCVKNAVFIISVLFVLLVCAWWSGVPPLYPWPHPPRGPERPTGTATGEAVTSETGHGHADGWGPAGSPGSGTSESEASCHLSLLDDGFHRSTDVTAQDHFDQLPTGDPATGRVWKSWHTVSGVSLLGAATDRDRVPRPQRGRLIRQAILANTPPTRCLWTRHGPLEVPELEV